MAKERKKKNKKERERQIERERVCVREERRKKEMKNREKFNIVIRSIGITLEKWMRILNTRKIR